MVKSCQIIAVALVLFLSAGKAYAIDLLFPVSCRVMVNCWITNHVDLLDDTGRAEDYMCGQKATDNNLSTHISLGSRGDVKRNVAVLAAEAGTVRIAGNVGGFCGGRVLIDHDGGWETSYCHLNPGTFQVREGQKVQRGQILAALGSSGQADWPRLSFALLRNGMVFDPFSGRTNLEGCSKRSEPLWAGGMNPLYEPAHVTNIGFTVGSLNNAAILNGTVAKAETISTETPQLTLWAMLMNVMADDQIHMSVTAPSGRILNETTTKARADREYFPIIFMTNRGNFLWYEGPYRGTITVTRRVHGNEITVGQYTTVNLVQPKN